MRKTISTTGCKRPEGSPLDLNNLPDDYSRWQTSSRRPCLFTRLQEKEKRREGWKRRVWEGLSVDFVPSKRETETLNQARQLVFRSDHNHAAQASPHLGNWRVSSSRGPNGASEVPQIFLWFIVNPHASTAITTSTTLPICVTHEASVTSRDEWELWMRESTSSYTCIRAPVGQGGKEGTVQEEGLSWGRGYSGAQHHMDPPSAINRFQDSF
ncbi:hypothetical protein Fmac_023147 [Flemingia macrophylla]|uniref:Uncharacterized protein n=1 Tax=Flemingia macrophylla TaxID=520843 RepID=A0ABD1LKN6_9FABA